MKKLFTLLVLMCCAIGMNAASYKIYVKGTQVTDANMSDVLGDGKVSYDPDTKTLTLYHASISVSGTTDGISIESDANIELIGTNTITSTGYAGSLLNIAKGCTATIYSDDGLSGVLDLSSDIKPVALYTPGTLTISNCTVNAIATNGYGISGEGIGELTITNAAAVNAQGKKGSICSLMSLVLDNEEIASPSGAKVSDSGKAVVDANGIVITDKVTIDPGTIYELIKVAGKYVTSLNCNDILGDGTMSYDDDTKTITMNNAKITSNSYAGLLFSSGNYTLKLVGNNSISTKTDALLYYFATLVITSDDGEGTLTCSASGDGVDGIRASGNLTIRNCSVNAFATGDYGGYGINGNGSSTLIIDNANVTANGYGGSIADWMDIQLNNTYIASPADAVIYDLSGSKCICVDGFIVRDQEVVIKTVPTYENIKVNGESVTDFNCNDILGDGTMSYDDATKTITMKNAKLTTSKVEYCIYLNKDDFTLKLVGTNSISGYSYGILTAGGKLTITSEDGTGTLNIEKSNYSGIETYNSALTIKNCNVTANGDACGLCGGYNDCNTSSLLIDNANVTANGTTEGSVDAWPSIQLNNAYIASPSDAVIDGLDLMSIKVNGEVVKGQDIVIKAGSAADTDAPTLPSDTKVKADATDSSIVLTWEAASDNQTSADALVYTINYKGKYGSWTSVDVTGKTTYTLEGLDADTDYTVMISVQDASGNSASYETLKTSTTAADAINDITADDYANAKAYNTTGSVVTKNYKGIVIRNGKKYLQK